MNCEETREHLLAHRYGALEDDAARDVEEHLASCPACRAALESAGGEAEILAEAARGDGEGLAFLPPARPGFRLVTRPRAAAAAALLLAAGGFLLLRTALRAPVLRANPRIVVTVPASFRPGPDLPVEVRAETIEGDPLPVSGTVRLEPGEGRATVRGRGPFPLAFLTRSVPPGGGAAVVADLDVGGLRRSIRLDLRAAHPESRAYLATDKPLYRPGEPVRVRAVLLDRFRLTPAPNRDVDFALLDPKGAETLRVRARTAGGVASTTIHPPADQPGGEYVVRVSPAEGTFEGAERKVSIRSYRVPRLTLDLALDRRSYAPGATGAGWLSVKRAEGGVPEGATVRSTLAADGTDVELGTVPIPESGAVSIPFALPASLPEGRVTLTAVVTDGGNVEAAAETVPVDLGRLVVELLPEGGDAVAGRPGRVYFRARTPAGAPADLDADVTDSRGKAVARARTELLGVGRFELEPVAGETYRLAGAELKPAAEGVTLRSVGDGPLSVEVASTLPGEHEVVAVCRGMVVARATARLEAGRPQRVDLEPTMDVGGVIRITVFDPAGRPRAERLVARAPARRLDVSLVPDRDAVAPGDAVRVAVRTRDEAGRPVPAVLGLCVTDDAVLALADDRGTASLPLHFLLGLEVKDLEDAGLFGFSPEAARATDLLLGTQGWRRFAWREEEAERERVRALVARYDDGDQARAGAAEGLRAADRKAVRIAGLAVLVLAVGGGVALLARLRPVRILPTLASFATAGAGALLVALAAEPALDLPVSSPAGVAPVACPAPGGFFFNDGRDGDFRGRAEATYSLVREYAPEPRVRRDFSEVLHWDPAFLTDELGRGEFTFSTSDSLTTFRAIAEGFDARGGLGRGEAVVASRLPFSVDLKLPAELSARDRLSLPAVVSNSTNEDLDVTVTLGGTGHLLRNPGSPERRLRVPANGSARALFDLVAGDGLGTVSLDLTAAGPGGRRDRIVRSVSVVPRGYPVEIARGGVLAEESTRIPLVLPPEMDRDSLDGELTIYPSALASLTEGLESLLRTPGGCFEQASSTNYPNVLILSYLERTRTAAPATARRARELLGNGYPLLAGYECGGRGYEWFGADPANPALTAYGLLEFTDMAAVHDVDGDMLARTKEWLLAGRDGEGGFRFPAGRALDTFGAAPADVTDAYVVWALTEAGATAETAKEAARLAERAGRSDDPYLVALAALSARNRGDGSADGLTARLAGMQAPDGSLAGTSTSITSSRGENLTVETTSLAAVAFLRDPSRRGEAERAIRYLLSVRRGGGGFGATQATILALRALVEHAGRAAEADVEMDLTIFVNRRVVGHGHVHEGMREPLVIRDEVLRNLAGGGAELEVRREGGAAVPWSLSLRYRARVPPSDAGCAVGVETSLDRKEAREGDTVALAVRLENREANGIPMVLVRVGVPGGTTPRVDRLGELVKSGEIAFFETRPREVILYLRGMAPGESKSLSIDLTATTPGTFESPATAAYLYYSDTAISWSPPLPLHIGT